MFEENEAFKMAFGEQSHSKESSDSLKDLPILTVPQHKNSSGQPMIKAYRQNDCFSWGNKTESQVEQTIPNPMVTPRVQLTQSRRINHLQTSQTLSRNRKFSSVHIRCQLPENKDRHENESRSEKSVDTNNFNEDIANYQKKQKEIANLLQNNLQELDIQGNFIKKIRNLQTKIKNLFLKHQNQLLKFKLQSKEAKEKLGLYQSYLIENHPSIMQAINAKLSIAQQQRNTLNCFSDSSNSQLNKDSQSHNSLTMPVFSQLQQVKLQGIKACDRLNIMNTTIKDLQIKQKSREENKQAQKAQKIFRKWSIPYMYSRQKKQSFQTTINSAQRQDRNSRNSSKGTEKQWKRLLNSFTNNNQTPIIKQFEYDINQANKHSSERFIHIDNYEMQENECIPESDKVAEVSKIQTADCHKCSNTRKFIQKMSMRLKKIPLIKSQSFTSIQKIDSPLKMSVPN